MKEEDKIEKEGNQYEEEDDEGAYEGEDFIED